MKKETEICKTKVSAVELLGEFQKYITEYGNCFKCMREIDYGKRNHHKTVQIASAFFDTARRSLEFNVLSNLYRIYEIDGESVGIKMVLNGIRKNVYSYENVSEDRKKEIKCEVEKFNSEYKMIETAVEKLKTLRNKRLAHFDKEYFLESDKLFNESSLKNEELVGLMNFAYEVCRSIKAILTGEGHLRFWLEPYVGDDECPYMSEVKSCFSSIRKIYETVDEYMDIPQ